MQSVAFSPDGKTCRHRPTYDSTVILWDVASRKPLGRAAQSTSGCDRVERCLQPDGETLATGSYDGTVT